MTTKITLPPPADLERICKGLATLDAILSEDWADRYYSFNATWDKKRKQRMASMRNGEGDHWFIVFTERGTFVKSFWHEHPRARTASIYAGVPSALKPQVKEKAFVMRYVTWGGFHDGEAWTLRGNAQPMRDELRVLSGDAKAFQRYARDVLGASVPHKAVRSLLAGEPLNSKLVASVGGEQTLRGLRGELAELGYGS